MTGWRSVLDLDYLAELGAAVDALGESDAETETPDVQSRVLVDVRNVRQIVTTPPAWAWTSNARFAIRGAAAASLFTAIG